MELDYAFLAEKADTLAGGSLVIFGGDIDTLTANQMPVTASFFIVSRFIVDPGEHDRKHTVSVDLTTPQGDTTRLLTKEILTSPNSRRPDEPSGSRVLINANLTIPELGLYRVTLFADEEEVKDFPLHITQAE